MKLDKQLASHLSPKVFGGKVRQRRLSRFTYQLFDLTKGEKVDR